jgi:hypothetical protein
MKQATHYTEQKKKMDLLFENIKNFKGDEEISSLLSKHLCILVSGYLENSIRDIIYDYAKTKSHQNIANFVSVKLKRIGNPKIEAILQLVGSFNSDWRDTVEKQLDDELKEAVNSIVRNRNQIAHGADVGITFGQIYRYYERSNRVIKIIEKECC